MPVSASCHSGVFRDAVGGSEHVVAPFLEPGGPVATYSCRSDSSAIHTYMMAMASAPSVRAGWETTSRRAAKPWAIIGIDVDHFDAELLRPQPPLRAFLTPVDAAMGFRVARPEHDHFAFLQAIFGACRTMRPAQAHAVAEMMHGAPVPAFPAVRIEMYLRHADGVAEAAAERSGNSRRCPLVMRAVINGNRPGPCCRFHAQNFPADDCPAPHPTDALVARDAAVLASCGCHWIEVHALHRIQQPLVRVTVERKASACGATVALRVGVNFRPRASMVHEGASLAS